MGLEVFGFIKDLVKTNPAGTDPKSEGDNHLRGIKETLVNQFPGFTEGVAITVPESKINDLAGVDFSAPFSFRNKLINGGMQVQQRPVGTLSADYSFGECDRWQFCAASASGVSGRIQSNPYTAYSSGMSGGVMGASWTNGFFYAKQLIEAKNAVAMNGKKVTLSVRIYQSTGGPRTFLAMLVKANAYDNFSSQTVIGSPVTLGTVQNSAPTLVSGTFTIGADDASNGIGVLIYDSQANTIVNKDYLIGDVQLEEGTVATPFENRPYGIELSLCQRYYEKTYDFTTEAEVFRSSYSGTYVYSVRFAVQKRTFPNVNVYAQSSGVVSKWRNMSSGADIPATIGTATPTGFYSTADTVDSGQYGFGWSASAEL